MARCKRTRNLHVHHKWQGGGNNLGNAIVLCKKCHQKTLSYGRHATPSKPFSEETKAAAIKIAKKRCQCRRINQGCH